ncbi:uncharacterized protein LOC136042350 isoform X2 [Artemia franciscana]
MSSAKNTSPMSIGSFSGHEVENHFPSNDVPDDAYSQCRPRTNLGPSFQELVMPIDVMPICSAMSDMNLDGVDLMTDPVSLEDTRNDAASGPIPDEEEEEDDPGTDRVSLEDTRNDAASGPIPDEEEEEDDLGWRTLGWLANLFMHNLLDDVESADMGPPPMSRENIEKLETVEITERQVSERLQCSICWEDYLLGESVRKMPCKHLFHKECISPWLELHGTCPNCRNSFVEERTEARSGREPNNRIILE